MTNRYKELVEEIADMVVYRFPSQYDSQFAASLIARILQAVVDGMPLPGEVGRDEVAWINDDGTSRGIVANYHLEEKLQEGDILIALSPFPRDPCGAGTGKEEEG